MTSYILVHCQWLKAPLPFSIFSRTSGPTVPTLIRSWSHQRDRMKECGSTSTSGRPSGSSMHSILRKLYRIIFLTICFLRFLSGSAKQAVLPRAQWTCCQAPGGYLPTQPTKQHFKSSLSNDHIQMQRY